MRWVSYTTDGTTEAAGWLEDDLVHGTGRTMLDLLGSGRLTTDHEPVETVALAEVSLLAPVPRPPSVRDFMAFENHVVTANAVRGRTVNPVWYQQPVFYFTNPAAVVGPTAPVPVAPGSQRWDYELEVGAVIGRAGRDLRPDDAEAHIAGYTIFCDWSARDLQAAEMKVGLGPAKGKDTATSLGPYLVTPDELEPVRAGNGFDLGMRASVNGRPYSSGTWADLYWSFGQMLAYASRGTELRPGDVIGSGTVGTGCILELSQTHGAEAYPWLVPGDQVTLEIDRLGVITSTVVAGVAPIPLK